MRRENDSGRFGCFPPFTLYGVVVIMVIMLDCDSGDVGSIPAQLPKKNMDA